MASFGDETIESYLYSSYNPYSYRCPKPKTWRNKSYFAFGDAETYFDNDHRAQLKSILAQINPNLTPRLRRPNTKDIAVQVNPKTDVSVQCSLGPRTLSRNRNVLRKGGREVQLPLRTGGAVVRYPRTLAVYSPITSRRLSSLLSDVKGEKRGLNLSGGDELDTTLKSEGSECETEAAEKAAKEKPSPEKDGNEEKDHSNITDDQKDETQSGKQGDSNVKGRVRFQFLEQKYGYYHCKECNLRWESAYVWCVQGTNKVYFKQFCRTCKKAFNPYRVEDITCQICNKARCVCPVTPRHVDPKRPHRQDLCGRCKGKRLSCDSTFSFKYII
ncbi:hypothetical protein AALO_G00123590 [Alosa alosa]|uniref:3CxxC-type domain-containing protein n=1 Tax=Alosa alosa TaxID=278164 RepID=A0AAV6GP38_9TELE|nr:zygote arrest protein 1 [Alosa alosa]KAG5275702.1 hypothetical protein AALO_G00123590 [Alosa alosa]